MTSFLDLRHLEPDQFHAMVKMHLSFLLDLNTDDCDCNHIYNCDSERANGGNGASTPGKSNTEAKRKRMQLLTPRRLLSSSDKAASSQVSEREEAVSNSASDLREGYPNSEPTAFRVTSRISKRTMKFACYAYSILLYLASNEEMKLQKNRAAPIYPGAK